MTYHTQQELERAGYGLKAAPEGDWRRYDERQPVPGYYQFDSLSARHPDLYHAFALSSLALAQAMDALVDLSDLEVLDVGAGTGRITLEVARKARRVTALDVFESVTIFGKRCVAQAGLMNVAYVRGDCAHLPLGDRTMDAVTCAWAISDPLEAYRVLRPGGYLIDLLPAPGALCGELTPLLANVYPSIFTEIAAASELDPACPSADFTLEQDTWNGVPVIPPVRVHDFTYTGDYGDTGEAAAILGRLFGPEVKAYILDGGKTGVSWRLRVVINRVRK